MKLVLVAFALLASWPSLAIASLQAPTSAGRQTAPLDQAAVDRLVEDALEAWEAPGLSISIVAGGEVLLSKGYGTRDPASGAAMTADTIFPLGSLTKQLTALGVGLLVDEGRIGFDEPVRSYLPEFRTSDPYATETLTIRDFLSHRSGLPELLFLYYKNDELDVGELMTRLPHVDFSTPIRSTHEYNNLGYAIVAEAAEREAGVEWEAFMAQRLFQPLEMTRTTLQPARAEADPNHVAGVVWLNGRFVRTPMPDAIPLSEGSGRIYSTADDLAKLMQMLLAKGEYRGRRIVEAATVRELQTTAIHEPVIYKTPERIRTGYALGWVTEVYQGEPLVQHGGNYWGYSTIMGLIPRQGIGVTVLVNQDSSRLGEAVMRTVMDRLLGHDGRDWTAELLELAKGNRAQQDQLADQFAAGQVDGTRPSHPLAAYVGTYSSAAYGDVIIRLEGGTLVAQRSGQVARLAHRHYDIFSAASGDFQNIWTPIGVGATISFIPATDGSIGGLEISGLIAPEGVRFSKAG